MKPERLIHLNSRNNRRATPPNHVTCSDTLSVVVLVFSLATLKLVLVGQLNRTHTHTHTHTHKQNGCHHTTVYSSLFLIEMDPQGPLPGALSEQGCGRLCLIRDKETSGQQRKRGREGEREGNTLLFLLSNREPFVCACVCVCVCVCVCAGIERIAVQPREAVCWDTHSVILNSSRVCDVCEHCI